MKKCNLVSNANMQQNDMGFVQPLSALKWDKVARTPKPMSALKLDKVARDPLLEISPKLPQFTLRLTVRTTSGPGVAAARPKD